MPAGVLVYGASGYSGHLIAREAKRLGLRPVLAGRDPDRVAAVASRLRLDHRVAPLSDPSRLDAALRGIRVVVNAAGPFSATAQPMVDACLDRGVHYLDITGEVPVIEALRRRDGEAHKHKILIVPGVGFDVVASDFLASHVAAQFRTTRHLAIGVSGLDLLTRGAARTLIEAANYGVVRRNGDLVRIPLGSLQRDFDYGAGPRPSINISWGDVAAAYHSTGVPNIEVYAEATPTLEGVLAASRSLGWVLALLPWQVWLKSSVDLLPEGPTAGERAARRMTIVAVAEDDRGRQKTARLRTPEAYTFTARCAARIAGAVCNGTVRGAGFRTPSQLGDTKFLERIAGVRPEEVDT
jgi:short subunit dehydrogenase-like uncharacterized protein